MRDNLIVNKSFDFALQIIKIATYLKEQRQYVIADQIITIRNKYRCKYKRRNKRNKQG